MQTEPLVNRLPRRSSAGAETGQSEIACHAEAACGCGWVNILVSLDPGATLPTKAHPSDIGYDVTAISLAAVHPNGAKTICTSEEQIRDLICSSFHNDKYQPAYYEIDTGVHIKPASGYYCELVPNSRQAKTTVSWNNSIGIIDPSYTGSIKIIIKHAQPSDLAKYLPGHVVGQLIIRPQLHANFTQVSHLPETDRGTGGFGSTANNHSTPTT